MLSDFVTGELLGEASLGKCVKKLPARARVMIKHKTQEDGSVKSEVKHEILNLDVYNWRELFDRWNGARTGVEK
jgi:hypothetical protein